MNICVVGCGYVGLTVGACFSEMGNKITCVDIDHNKINKLKGGLIPIFEPGLEQIFLKNANALILFTEWKEFRSPDFEEIKSLLKSSIIFDGRNQYNAFNLEEKGFEYYQIGKNNFFIK